MRVLVVFAHPVTESLTASLARRAVDALTGSGHEVRVLDLYAHGFEAVLSRSERSSYYTGYDGSAVAFELEQLTWAEALVIVFPTWWFSFPAILKGWFDRVWAPGVAYDHANDLGRIRPRLIGLRRVLAVTFLGSPWWVDWLVMRRPVRRVLKSAILAACAPRCEFQMLSLYRSERPDERRVTLFQDRMLARLAAWGDG